MQRYNAGPMTAIARGFHSDLAVDKRTWLMREYTYVWPIYVADGVSATLEFEHRHGPNPTLPSDLSILGNGTCTRNVIRLASGELLMNGCASHRVSLINSHGTLGDTSRFLRLRAVIIAFAQDA